MVVDDPSVIRILFVVNPSDEVSPRGTADGGTVAVEVSVVGDVSAAETYLQGNADIDCIVTRYDLRDGTGTDVYDMAAPRGIPVVLLVEETDGGVPAGALDRDFTVRITTGEELPAADRLGEAIGAALFGEDGELPPGMPSERWEEDAWKASVHDQLFENLPVHMFIKDRNARITHVTEGPIDGRTHEHGEAFLGNRDIDGVVPLSEALNPYLDDLRVLESGETVVNKEEHFPSTGQWVLTSKIPLRDEDDEIVGLAGVGLDITDRKERELQLRALNHLLRHTLRNDVNVIQGWAEMLVRDEDGDAPDGPEYIVRAAERLVSRLDKQQAVVDVLTTSGEPVTLDVAGVVREICAAVGDRHPDAELELSVPDRALARATEEFGDAVDELVENAVVHDPADEPVVRVAVEAGADGVRVRVADEGPAIPEMEVAILTGERSIEALYHGTGLGLWMVNWVVRRSGGSLSFEQPSDGGNVVTVTLPGADADVADADAADDRA